MKKFKMVLVALAAIVTMNMGAFAQAEPSTGDKQVDSNIREANAAHERDRQQQEHDRATQNDRDSRGGVTIDKGGVRD